jgi:hypothetical protein
LSRAGLLRRGLAGGGALVAAGSLGSLAARAAAAAPDSDLAALRLLIGVELLALDFQGQALASGKLAASSAVVLKKMQVDEQAHYTALALLLTRSGGTPATADDVDFSYPRATFATERSILAFADDLEALQLGAYVGANGDVQTPQLRVAIGQISANEAQHVAALWALGGKPVIGKAFGPALSSDAVTAILDDYES